MVEFEARHPGRCLRLRYEDLVTRTDDSMEEVWDLFGVEGSQWSDAFAGSHDPLAPADYKIWHTRAVHAESIGEGARIPPERLGIPVRDAMNQLLATGIPTGRQRLGERGSEPAVGAPDGTLEIRVVDGHAVLPTVVHWSSSGRAMPAASSGGLRRRRRRACDARRTCSGTENFGAASSGERCVVTATSRSDSGARSISWRDWPGT